MAEQMPHSKEAEEATIGAVFIAPEMYYEISRVIKSSDFFIIRNSWIWQAFEDLVQRHANIDYVTVSEEMDKAGRLAEAGGQAYLTAMLNSVPQSYNAISYAEIVKDHSERRRGIGFASVIASAAYDESKKFSLGEHAQKIAVASINEGKRVTTSDAASQMIDLLEDTKVCTTGLFDVDKKVGGLFPNELSILAGYQGTGKSAEKLQGARKNAENGKKVLLVDLEMTAAQTWFRISCGDLGMDVNQARSGRLNSETLGKLINYAAELAEFYKDKMVMYNAPMTPNDILSAAMIERPDIIYIDTLKNISGKPSKDSPRDWYDNTLNFLRVNVAQNKAISAHVQVLHHINRSTFRESRKPTLHDLMFAGESDADTIFILYRKTEDYLVVNDGQVRTVVPVTWITDKSRFGWTGEEDVNFKLINQTFYGMSRQEDEKDWQKRRDLE